MSYNFDMRNGPVNIEWFKGGTTNISYNCLDRNIERGLGDSPCFIWEGNEPSAPLPAAACTELHASPSSLTTCKPAHAPTVP